MKDPRINLHDIGRFAREIAAFSEGVSFGSFAADTLRVRAVSYCLPAVGEAAFHLERSFPGFLNTEVSADVAWCRIAGTWNFLTGGCDRIDPGSLRKVIERDLEPLLDLVETGLARLADEV